MTVPMSSRATMAMKPHEVAHDRGKLGINSSNTVNQGGVSSKTVISMMMDKISAPVCIKLVINMERVADVVDRASHLCQSFDVQAHEGAKHQNT